MAFYFYFFFLKETPSIYHRSEREDTFKFAKPHHKWMTRHQFGDQTCKRFRTWAWIWRILRKAGRRRLRASLWKRRLFRRDRRPDLEGMPPPAAPGAFRESTPPSWTKPGSQSIFSWALAKTPQATVGLTGGAQAAVLATGMGRFNNSFLDHIVFEVAK